MELEQRELFEAETAEILEKMESAEMYDVFKAFSDQVIADE